MQTRGSAWGISTSNVQTLADASLPKQLPEKISTCLASGAGAGLTTQSPATTRPVPILMTTAEPGLSPALQGRIRCICTYKSNTNVYWIPMSEKQSLNRLFFRKTVAARLSLLQTHAQTSPAAGSCRVHLLQATALGRRE